MQAKKKGVLFLSHQGFSFIEDLIAVAKKQNLEAYVLSSKPQVESQRKKTIKGLANRYFFTSHPSLHSTDIDRALTILERQNRKVLACLSVWEGYRGLMAKTNETLKATDISQKTVDLLTDKYRMRNLLKENNLSKINTDILTPSLFDRFQSLKTSKFIKPRRGLASFASSRLSDETTWSEIEKTKKKMLEDPEYNSVFKGSDDFIVEDYIEGKEFSFEIIVTKSKPFITAVHEKLEVEEAHGSVLENSCVSPPVSISKNEVKKAEVFLKKCLSTMGVTTGCYHIEARFNKNSIWEIIEINPRVGGALIKESVRETTSGVCLLELWLKTILVKTKKDKTNLLKELNKNKKYKFASFFRVFFGEPGRKIRSIVSSATLKHEPEIIKIAVTAGTILPNSTREIFLGQALWKLKMSSFKKDLKELLQASQAAVEVRYE